MTENQLFLAIQNPTHEDIDYAQEIMSKFQHQEYIEKKLKSNMKFRFKGQNVYKIGE